MKEEFKLVTLSHDGPGRDLDFLNPRRADEIRAFHKSFPMYAPTPLAHLKNTAEILGLGDIHVKDESYRFGLNAFKVLGGSFAIGNFMAGKLAAQTPIGKALMGHGVGEVVEAKVPAGVIKFEILDITL